MIWVIIGLALALFLVLIAARCLWHIRLRMLSMTQQQVRFATAELASKSQAAASCPYVLVYAFL